MRALDAETRTLAPTATARRLSLLAAASLLAPTILLAQHLQADTQHEPVIAVACMALFLLVLARMTGLVSVQRITAVTDGLTQLRTRGYFTETLRTECERARRSSRPVGLVIADADHFKRINDTYGHPAGDQVLIEIGKRLRQHSRASDTIARYGGEEFVILLPEATIEYAAAVGERIRAGLAAAPFLVNAVDITISVGAASTEGRRADPESLLRTADEALYAAKHRGRNQVVAATVHADTPQPVRTKPSAVPATVA
jgi:two-component system, cell cycle response regulator